ncbi:MAG: SGNH/GDSL hydrolase family protein [Planctomycetes bacterium]|nr:SGNH/GDSL hydrolase family protein [Planctomycetota bacterium]
MNPRLRLLTLLLGLAAGACTLVPVTGKLPKEAWAGAAALVLAASASFGPVNAPWRWLRARPIACWCVALLATVAALGAWTCHAQPVWGRWPSRPELGALAAVLVVALAPFVAAPSPAERALQRERLARSAVAKLLLVATSFAFAFFAVEAVLRTFYVQSDGFAVTAMHRAWVAVHWKPINALRYRDREPVDEPGVKRVLVVGDSFAAGHGLDELDDAFARVLERGLGAGWRVNIAARPGWSTDAEYAALVKYPLKPDVIVLSYYVNDMSYLLPKDDDDFRAPPPGLGWFANGFFSTSYLYWHTLQGGMERVHEQYAKKRLAEYDDPALWSRHAADLDRFVELATAQGVKLVVLVWPRLDGVEGSRGATEKVSAHFRARGVAVVDLTNELAPIPSRDLIVNRLDAHPNAATHARAGERLVPVVASP